MTEQIQSRPKVPPKIRFGQRLERQVENEEQQ
jgi:hypothetical protein